MAHRAKVAVLLGTALFLAQAGAQAAPAASAIAVAPPRLSFGAHPVGSEVPPRTVLLTNSGNDPVTLTLGVTGDFALAAPTGPATLQKGTTIAAAVRFKPRRKGTALGVLTILDEKSHAARVVPLLGTSPDTLGMNPSRTTLADLGLAVFLALFYWSIMVIVRWNRVATPSRFVLCAQIKSIETELSTLEKVTPKPPFTDAGALLASARNLIDSTRIGRVSRIFNCLFWSRGQELTGWGYTYEAQKQMVPLLSEPTVRARLETLAAQLEASPEAACRAVAEVAKKEITLQPAEPSRLPRLQAVLAQALSAYYDREYNTYADLVSWQNKASWLVFCGLLLIVVLTGVFPNQSVLFLVGATGGLVSRLSRSLNRKDAPTDYGASWTTLFLSPVAGALGAWAGIVVANLAVQLGILSSKLVVGWDQPFEAATLALALAFGFSERLLSSVFDNLDAKVLNEPAASNAASAQVLDIADPGPLTGKVGTSESVQLRSTGGTGKVTWELPPPATAGVSITSDGMLTWNPTQKGPIPVNVQAKDAASHVKQRQLTVNVA